MLNENAKKWIAALRSGRFVQGNGKLRTLGGFCCLGVACELAVKEGILDPARLSGLEKEFYTYDSNSNYLPDVIVKWLGLTDTAGGFGPLGNRSALSYENDRGVPFSGIANLIESEPQGLFMEELHGR